MTHSPPRAKLHMPPGYSGRKSLLTYRSVLCACLLQVSCALISQSGAAEIGANEAHRILSFTIEQAQAGREPYAEHCADCHGVGLQGKGVNPALYDDSFDIKWGGKAADVLAEAIWRMPPGSAGELSGIGDAAYANIMAMILHANGLEPSTHPLPNDLEKLSTLSIPRVLGIESEQLHRPNASIEEKNSLLRVLSDVSDETLLNPDSGDWVQWGRTYDGHSHSPLTQINTENVSELTLAWNLPLQPAASHAAPLVYKGVMYLNVFPDTVLAMDAANGSILWRYQHHSEAASSGNMGISIRGDRLFLPTSDMNILAIDYKSGELKWEQRISPEFHGSFRSEGFFLRSTPMVVGNKVIQGVSAPRAQTGGFIIALDFNTGEEVWRFNSIPRPGEFGDNSWNGIPFDQRSGGSVWQHGTYDAQLNLIYYGVAPTYDTAPLLKPIDDTSATNDALYTNSTLAINPDTGNLVWHYQHLANGQWDLDWAFERQVVDIDYQGTRRKAVITIGKMGILDALDAASGSYLFSIDMGVQNYIAAIDPETGIKTVDQEKSPHSGMDTLGCPHLAGVRNWPPTALHATLGMLYVPVFENCAQLFIGEGATLSSGLAMRAQPNPEAPQGMLGRLQSVRLDKQQLDWYRYQGAPFSTGLLTTESNLVFVGDVEPSIQALEATTGQVLWRHRLEQAPAGRLMTYSTNGRQYIAVSVGVTNQDVKFKLGMYNTVTGSTAKLSRRGSGLLVFSLPEENEDQ